MRLSNDVKAWIRRRAGRAEREAIVDQARSRYPAVRELGQAMLEAISPQELDRTAAELDYPFFALGYQPESRRLLRELKREMPALTEWWFCHFVFAMPNYLRRCLVAYNRGEDEFARVLVELLAEAAQDGMIVERARREDRAAD